MPIGMAVDADQALDLVDRQPPAAQGFGHLAAGRLEAGEQLRGRFLAVLGRDAARRSDQRLLDVGEQFVGFLDQPRSFFEAAAGAVEHGFDFDEASGKIGFRHW